MGGFVNILFFNSANIALFERPPAPAGEKQGKRRDWGLCADVMGTGVLVPVCCDGGLWYLQECFIKILGQIDGCRKINETFLINFFLLSRLILCLPVLPWRGLCGCLGVKYIYMTIAFVTKWINFL